MFKVQCPDCDAPYQVDERRVPPDGIKMRCPKCGGSFHVARPQPEGEAAPTPMSSMPAPVLSRGADGHRPPPPMRRAHQATMLGVAPSKTPEVTGAPAAPQPGVEGGASPDHGKPPDTLRAVFGSSRSAAPHPPRASSNPATRPVRDSSSLDSRGHLDASADLPVPRPAGAARGVTSLSGAGDAGLPAPRAFSRAKFPSAVGIEDDLPDSSSGVLGNGVRDVGSSGDAGEADLDLPSLGERMHGERAVAEPAQHNASQAKLGAGIRDATADAARAATAAAKPAVRGAPRPGGGASGADLPALSTHAVGGRDLPSLTVEGNSLPQLAQRSPGEAQPESKKGAVRRGAPTGTFELELDVPSLAAAATLPELAGARGRPAVVSESLQIDADSPSLPELELPSPGDALELGADGGEWELPSPRGGQASSFAAGLPELHVGGLPAVPAAGLPVAAAGLPVAAAGLPVAAAGLPVAAAGLPVAAAGLPSVTLAHLPENVAGLPGIGSDMPTLPRGSAKSQIAAPGADWSAAPPAPAIGTALSATAWSDIPESGEGGSREEDWGGEAAFGEVNLGEESGADAGDLRFDSSLRAGSSGSGELVREAGGGTSFGEVNLGGGPEGEGVVDLRSPAPGAPDEDMEFGAIPQEPTEGVGHVDAAAGATRADPRPGLPPQERAWRRRRRWLAVGAVLAVIVIGGAALSLVPGLGPYGVHYIVDALNHDEYERVVEREVQGARTALKKDTFGDYQRAVAALETAIARNERLPSLVVYAAFVGELGQLRFGPDPRQKARADVRLSQFEERDDRYLTLARTALAASDGEFAKARAGLARRGGASSSRADMGVLAGELELAAGNAEKALKSWEAAESIEKSARTAYGMARAMVLAGDLRAAQRSMKLTLERNPGHLGARILEARAFWRLDRDLNTALNRVEAVTRDSAQASPEELVQALTLLGNIHLEMSHISAAEAAYTSALKIRPQAGHALAGLGDALYRAGRYSEALARFEAAAQADPNDVVAAVGVAKTKISLEKLREASTMLKKLRDVHAKSALVHYWYGRAEEALGNRDEAEKAYRCAVGSGEKTQAVVEAYVALALLMNQQGRRDEAQSLLLAAREKLGESSDVHKALGQLSFSQGRYDEALARFRDAEKLDPRDLSTKFHVGATLSRLRRFEEAAKSFDEVAAVDRDFPGLALERGLLYETSGRGEEALKMYQSALAKAPNDPDLMLRVGCGNVLAGRSEQAIGLLNKVLLQKPQSAETNHCLGRAMLLEGKNLAEALRFLNRAVELDPHRSEYYLYVGWAANEAGRVSEAEKALRRALELDQGLADAYWQRGVLRYRQGAVKDAVADLVKALELRPSRAEARAALADTYYDLGRESLAMDQWRLAIDAQPDNGTWRFRYGRLLAQNRNNNEARSELRKALELAEAMDPKPRWVWDAHRLLARAIGRQAEAIGHWESFLRMAPQDNVYRDEAKAELKQLGKPWDGL